MADVETLQKIIREKGVYFVSCVWIDNLLDVRISELEGLVEELKGKIAIKGTIFYRHSTK
jgi:hypothetical protein